MARTHARTHATAAAAAVQQTEPAWRPVTVRPARPFSQRRSGPNLSNEWTWSWGRDYCSDWSPPLDTLPEWLV